MDKVISVSVNFASLRDDDLLQLKRGIEEEITRRQAAKQKESERERLEALAQEKGVEVSELAERKVYRNPWNQWETWRGRGRRPGWLKAYEQQGGDIADLLD